MRNIIALVLIFSATATFAATRVVVDHGTFNGHETKTIMTFDGKVLEKQVFLVKDAPQYDRTIVRQPDGTYKQVTTFVGWGIF